MYGPAEIAEKFGCRPDQIIDLLAIVGDSSDNVPGIKGVGEKGAAKLLQEFGSLASVYERLGEIKNARLKTALEEGQSQVPLSRKLVTIVTDHPVDCASLLQRKTHWSERSCSQSLHDFFEKLEFRTLAAKTKEKISVKARQHSTPGDVAALTSTPPLAITPVKQTERDYRPIQTKADLASLSAQLMAAEVFAFDSETTGLDVLTARIIGLSFSLVPGQAFYLSFLEKDWLDLSRADIDDLLAPVFAHPETLKVAHNLKFDLAMLKREGFAVKGPLADTLLASYLIDASARSHGLDACAKNYLGMDKIPTSSLIGKKGEIPMADASFASVVEYACEDADATLQLWQIFGPLLRDRGLTELFETIEVPLALLLGEIEERGVYVDSDKLLTISEELESERLRVESQIYELAGERFAIQSTKVLQNILFEKLAIHQQLGMTRLKKTKTGFSTDVTVLEKLAGHPIAKAILDYRSLAKLKSTYVDALPQWIHPKDGRIHAHFHQTGTTTGRLSCSDPNLQNIPIRAAQGRRVREVFKAQLPGWVLLSADYSQIELRILAHLSQDPGLLEAYRKDEDIHALTASKIFSVQQEDVSSDQRAAAKAINFGIIYGMGPQRLARETNVSVDKAKDFIERYFAGYPKIRDFIDRAITFARDKEYTETIMGRRRPLPDIHSKVPQVLAAAENMAVNSPIQGSAADLIKVAMLKVASAIKEQGLAGRLIMQIHDELVIEAPQEEADHLASLVKNQMESAVELSVRLKVEVGIGQNWLKAHG